MLDEPTEGLAPVIVEQLARDVLRICDGGKCSLLLCEQSVWFARKCTEYVYLIDSGRLVFSGTWTEFDANEDYDKRREPYRMSGQIVHTKHVVQSAEGDKNGQWTTVVAAAVFLFE